MSGDLFQLTSYTEEEIARLEKQKRAHAELHRPLFEPGEFVLTGSDRPADVAVAKGQKELK